jgi:cytoskeleton protein RodZ
MSESAKSGSGSNGKTTNSRSGTSSTGVSSTNGAAVSIGAQVSAARLASGLSLEAVADRLKVRPSILEAIEADRYADLPEPIYTRSYLERLAQIVGLDAKTIVAQYDARAGSTAGKNVIVPKISAVNSNSRARVVIPAFAFVLAGAVIAAGGFWVWRTQLSPKPQPVPTSKMDRMGRDIALHNSQNNTLNAPSAGDPSVLVTVKINVTSNPSGAAVLLDRFKIGVTPLKDAPVSGGLKRELRLEKAGFKPYMQTVELTGTRNFSVALEPAPPATVGAASPAAPATTDATVTLRFRGRSWLRVTDNSGKVLFEGIPEAGSTQSYSVPVNVRAGRPDVISATVGGQTRDALGGANPGSFKLP